MACGIAGKSPHAGYFDMELGNATCPWRDLLSVTFS